MTTTLDLPQEIRDLENKIYYLDEDDVNFEELKVLLESKMNQKKWSVEQAANYYADLVFELNLKAEQAKEVAEKTAKRAKSAQNKADYTKAYLKQIAKSIGLKKIRTDYVSVSIFQGRENAYIPEGFDATQLPDEFRKDIPAVSKAMSREITKALKEGRDVCGLTLLRGEDVIRFG